MERAGCITKIGFGQMIIAIFKIFIIINLADLKGFVRCITPIFGRWRLFLLINTEISVHEYILKTNEIPDTSFTCTIDQIWKIAKRNCAQMQLLKPVL